MADFAEAEKKSWSTARPAGSNTLRPVNIPIKFRSDDVLVATFPRSGTTWSIEIIRQLHLHHLSNTQQHLSNTQQHPSNTQQHHLETEVGKGGEFLEHYLFRDGNAEELLEAVQSPRILKTHAYYEECGFLSSGNHCKIIFVVRDPKDTICSLFGDIKGRFGDLTTINNLQDFADSHFGENVYLHGSRPGPTDWCSFTKGYLTNTHNYPMLYVKYEDLKHDTAATITKINAFLGHPSLTPDEIERVIEATIFDKMRGTHKEVSANTVGKSGAGKTKLSTENIAAVNKRVMELVDQVGDEKMDLRSYAE